MLLAGREYSIKEGRVSFYREIFFLHEEREGLGGKRLYGKISGDR
jgi:hypothetical protein